MKFPKKRQNVPFSPEKWNYYFVEISIWIKTEIFDWNNDKMIFSVEIGHFGNTEATVIYVLPSYWSI